MKSRVLVIIVTYNSDKYIQWCIGGLDGSNMDITIRVVDSGSNDNGYLYGVNSLNKISIIKEENIGFVAGNNVALYDLADFDWVLFLNPDARIEADALDKLISYASDKKQEKVGAFSVPLVRYDIEKKCGLNVFDSVGISCNCYGRWRDLYSNSPVKNFEHEFSSVDAICGAFMLIRSSALQRCVDSKRLPGFERSYYMYKEDIELSQRLIKSGWIIGIYNLVTAFHCRGWSDSRHQVPYWARWHSAKNDVDVAVKYKWRALPLAISKYIWVRLFEKK